ncbi:DUF6234 family protein [Streptomyces sp. NPDC048483]|uniref:DUF6234 family protein n=1 Tax=Streptomyces sp. NPDC048483 TaxID=3154927 RepID=UPI003446AFF2
MRPEFAPHASAPPPEARGARRRGSPAGDIALAVLVLVSDVVAVAALTFFSALSAWEEAGMFGDSSPREESPSFPDEGLLIAYGVVVALLLLTAYGFVRTGRPVTASAQILAAVAVCAVVAYGAAAAQRDAPPAPVPASSGGANGHQCHSGGDNHECRDSGG